MDDVQDAARHAGDALLPVVDVAVETTGKAAANALSFIRDSAHDAPEYTMQAASSIADGASNAVRVAGSVLGTVAEAGGDAISTVVAVGGKAVTAAGEVGGHAVSIAGEVGGKAISLAGDAGGKAISALSAAGGQSVAFLAAAGAGIPGRQWADVGGQIISNATRTLRKPLGKLFDWVRFDVFVSFWQIVSLFFASIVSEAMARAKAFFGNVSNIISIDWSFTVPAIPPAVIFGIIGALAITLLCCFCCAVCKARSYVRGMDTVRRGPEAASWETTVKNNAKTVKWIKYTLLAALTLYLPASRVCLQVFTCDPGFGSLIHRLDDAANCTQTWMPGTDATTDSPGFYQKTFGSMYECDCSSWKHYNATLVCAIIVFVLYTVGLPFMCAKLINASVPRGSTEDPDFRYDEDGNRVKYTDAMYRKDLETDSRYTNSPFLILFDGYERKGRHYKLVGMTLKLALVLPAIVLWDRVVAQVSVSLVILACFAVLTFYTRPFLDPVSDFMESVGRVAAFCTALFGLIGSKAVAPNSAAAMGALINIVNAINFTIMLVCMLFGIRAVRKRLQRFNPYFEFTDTVIDKEGGVDLVRNWDVRLETKHRVWMAFWDALLEVVIKDAEVTRRFKHLLFITQDNGKARITDHFRYMFERGAYRHWIQHQLEGVDVYWNGPVKHGSPCGTRFGRMYIVPYPFHCVMVFDDGDAYTFIHEEEFMPFLQQNIHPETMRRRGIRRQLRALSGHQVFFEYSRTEQHRVEDGTETYRDHEGKQKTRTRYTMVSVLMRYSTGTFSIAQNRNEVMAEGFGVSLLLTDGHGVAIAPHTGKHHDIRAHCTVGEGVLGITPTYDVTPDLSRLLGVNQRVWQENLTGVEARYATYRRELTDKRVREEEILSSAFWLHVYDADSLPRQALEYYFTNCEANPLLKEIPIKYKPQLDYLYGQMSFIRCHPCAAFWFTFFADVWQNNKDAKSALSNAAAEPLMNPAKPTALAYTPMTRADLEKKLSELKLLGRWGMFSRPVLDTLYSKMAELDQSFLSASTNTSVQVQPKKPTLDADPSNAAAVPSQLEPQTTALGTGV